MAFIYSTVNTDISIMIRFKRPSPTIGEPPTHFWLIFTHPLPPYPTKDQALDVLDVFDVFDVLDVCSPSCSHQSAGSGAMTQDWQKIPGFEKAC